PTDACPSARARCARSCAGRAPPSLWPTARPSGAGGTGARDGGEARPTIGCRGGLPHVHCGGVPDSSLARRPREIGDRPLVAATRLNIAVEVLHRLTLFNCVADPPLRQHLPGVGDPPLPTRPGAGR